MKKLIISTVLSLAVFGSGYSGHAADPKATGPATVHWNKDPLQNAQKMSFSDVPEAVKKAAQKRIGTARVEDVDKGTLNGKTIYELAYKKGKNSTKTYELRVTEDGKILGEHTD